MPQAPAPNLTLHRVKVYKLNSEGGWDDKGTGLVSVEYMKQSDAMGLVVISEEDTRTLLIHRVSKDDIYHRQGDDTIITWTDPHYGTDIALSFQEATGCNHIWEQIQAVQLNDHQPHPDMVGQRRRVVDEFESVSGQFEGDFTEADNSDSIDIPAPEMGNLEEIAKVLTHVSPFQRERMASQLNAQNHTYVKRLLELFRQCEDLEDRQSLAFMYRIFKGMIMLNDTSLLEELLKEEYVMDVMGALEYDPDLNQPQKHRDYLRESVTFKEVVPISDPLLVAKIHQTYRIQYMKDVILPRALDDATHATLTSLALFNNVEVILALHQDASFLPQLFIKLKKASPGDPEWDDLVAFLQELCNLAKHLQPAHKLQLYSKLVSLGLFEVVTKVMKHGSQEVKLRATDILMSCVSHDSSPLRSFLSKRDFELFSLLIEELLSGEHCGLAEQVAELLKIMMDPENSEQGNEKNEFLDMFYENYVQKLVYTLAPEESIPNGDQQTEKPAENAVPPSSQSAIPSAHVAGLIVELLCFCVQNHAYRIKYYILRNQVVDRVLRALLKRREKWLVVAAVRFLRTCIGLRDEFYNRYLIRSRVFHQVLEAFLKNGDRYNMLNSAVLEMVEFIRRENIRNLVAHFVKEFDQCCQHVDYVDTFKQLKIKFEQSQERSGTAGPTPGADDPSFQETASSAHRSKPFFARQRRDARDLDKDEESYFSEDDFALEEDEDNPPDHALPTSSDANMNVPRPNSRGANNNSDSHHPSPGLSGNKLHLVPPGAQHTSPTTSSASPQHANSSSGLSNSDLRGDREGRTGLVGSSGRLGTSESSRRGARPPSPPAGNGGVVVDSGGWQGLALVDYDDDDDEEMHDATTSSPRQGTRQDGAGAASPATTHPPSSPGEKRPGDPGGPDPSKRPRPEQPTALNGLDPQTGGGS